MFTPRGSQVQSLPRPPRLLLQHAGARAMTRAAPVAARRPDQAPWRRAPALDHVSLSCGAGEFLALVGPSGSGKTTLLKSINRLVEPDEGMVRLGGRDVARTSRSPSCAGASATSSRGSACFRTWMSPRISGWCRGSAAPRAADRDARVAELLDLVALPARIRAADATRAFGRPGAARSASPGRSPRGRS